MRISEKISRIRDLVTEFPGSELSKEIESGSWEAMKHGIKDDAWKRYMSHFCSNAKQLERLCGMDNEFMNDPDEYGKLSLAYIIGSGPCGGGTRLGMAANMPPLMRMHLDNNITNGTGPGECMEWPPKEAGLLVEKAKMLGFDPER